MTSTISVKDTPITQPWIRGLVESVRDYGIHACERKALAIAPKVSSGKSVNIGGGKVERWPEAITLDAMFSPDMDFNTCEISLASNSMQLVICEQVIEHLHNTTWFLRELRRILMPGGRLLLSTENLVSLPNLFAMLFQRAPFSTQSLCGRFSGGWKKGLSGMEQMDVKENHPTFSGVRGHVRVMTVSQLREVLARTGFMVNQKFGFAGNHYVLFECQ